MLRKLILAVAFCLSLMPAAQARIYYLPDYQRAFLYGSRIEQSNTSPHTTPTCNTYGLYSAASRPSNAECAAVSPVPGLSCYRCTICASTYIYNSSNCTGEYVLSGSSCGGKYNKCICNPDKYVATADGGGCTTGQKVDTSKSCVDKTTGKTLYTCIADPCYGLADNETELGCDQYYAKCPSKCEIGTTCKRTDCSAYTLTSCPAGKTCKSCTPGCGDTAPRYREQGLAFQVDSPAGGKIIFTITGTNYQIDWGDGTIDTNNTHTYATAGLYDIEIFGDVTTFLINSSPSAEPKRLYSLNLPKAKKITLKNACPTLTGTIPPLPKGLTDGTSMFDGCSKLTGSIPKLPGSLTNGYVMFAGCKGLTGNIPALPDSLTYGRSMFSDCKGLTGTIPALPTKLTNGSTMFSGCAGLTGTIPALPTKLTSGSVMFSGCAGLTGSIPVLPTTLTEGEAMFEDCKGLTGTIPALPPKLVIAHRMFRNCRGLTGGVPSLPRTLWGATAMFENCSGLTGTIPPLPAGLHSAGSCTDYPDTWFQICTAGGDWGMFQGCSGLTGMAPAKPSGLTQNYSRIFKGTQVTNDGSWPDGAWY